MGERVARWGWVGVVGCTGGGVDGGRANGGRGVVRSVMGGGGRVGCVCVVWEVVVAQSHKARPSIAPALEAWSATLCSWGCQGQIYA